jgi:ATP-binding cassette subfamily F protein uup
VREEHWLTYGVTARRKRNVRRLEQLHGLRQERREQKRLTGNVKLTASEGATSGALVVEAQDISKSFGKRPIVAEFSTRIIRGDRVGVVGPNGAGKTTLLKLLTGEVQPDSGRVRLGSNLELASLDQGRRSLHPEATLKDVLTGGGSDTLMINGTPKHVVGYMKDFLFTPEQAGTAVSKLSGGERGRLALARALALPSNVLVLDEPTNDLDLETLDLLQEMVADYAGTVVVVSHDRDFLDRVATSTIVAEGDGHWTEYAGGYTDMVAQRGHGVRAPQKPVAAPKAKSAEAAEKPAPPAPKRKLSFKEKHALETLPGDIEKLETEIAKLQQALADPALYQKSPNDFAKKSQALEAAETRRAEAEERWLELEILREEIEG